MSARSLPRQKNLGLYLDNKGIEERALRLKPSPVPKPKFGECLIEVTYSGVCGTDVELTRGYYPYSGFLGHEFVGVVRSVGLFPPSPPQSSPPLTSSSSAQSTLKTRDSRNAEIKKWIGKRVVGEINVNCLSSSEAARARGNSGGKPCHVCARGANHALLEPRCLGDCQP